ncbi:MAG: transcriptional repressor [Armatimonadetes bacterium]|nr:transcriptional repressor [Armatimonadota bacterium]
MRVRKRKGAIQIAASGYEASAVETLRQRGFRITMPRVQVLRVLSLADRPLNPYAIHQEIVASGGRTDAASVYRILDTLSNLRLVHRVGIVDGYMACRLEEAHGEETEHVVCSVCGKVTELPLPDDIASLTSEQLADLGYRQVQTKVEILAVCPDCN